MSVIKITQYSDLWHFNPAMSIVLTVFMAGNITFNWSLWMYLVPPPDNYYEIEASEIRWAKAEYTVHRQQCRQEKKKKDKRHEKYLLKTSIPGKQRLEINV